MMNSYDVTVIGGGAAGLVAAISAKRKGANVLICEKTPRPGKKILITGAGRCNLLNERLDASFFNPEAKTLAESIFAKFGKNDILSFFEELGLQTYCDEGRIFPITNQASSVLSVIEIEISRLGIPSEYNSEITGIRAVNNGFELVSKNHKHFTTKKVILTGGGKSYPATGSDGNVYALAQTFGHRIIEPVPSTVPLLARDPWCHFLQGQKVSATVTAVIDDKPVRKMAGEVLFTKYGLSGTAILDVSEDISIAIHRNKIKNVSAEIDVVPFFEKEVLIKELQARLNKNIPPENILAGILPNKFAIPLSDLLKQKNPSAIATALKSKPFKIEGTRGWNEAEFTAGGVDTSEINPNSLESKLESGLYFAGEILNVNGVRGGYNLAWAWASGFVAGLIR
jgi:hypothetical protein